MFLILIAAGLLGTVVCIAGLGLVVRSLVSASRRGQPLVWRFWAPAESLLDSERSDNRRGFWLSLAGLAILAAAVLMMANAITHAGAIGPAPPKAAAPR